MPSPQDLKTQGEKNATSQSGVGRQLAINTVHCKCDLHLFTSFSATMTFNASIMYSNVYVHDFLCKVLNILEFITTECSWN